MRAREREKGKRVRKSVRVMSRLRFKGGAWTNSEDEVLRASLTVYGLQNWERVASMLVRKTAAQCRERWENYLDPRLHIREEWTAEEEEHLVQLQSLFANQWNLIARELRRRCGMNRPAWLCEDHYHALLDALEHARRQREGGRGEAVRLEDFMAERRRHRAVHQGHETRPARPDAVNSDVFEKEMVEFAVSRLANQDGKKGLRKERKKQLEHTSFLAKLQSNREAIESGTLSAKAKKRMERAMLEDRAGPGGTKLEDGILEDEMGSDVDENESKSGGKGRFQPIDLGADKQEAGIQAKKRVLVKDLSSAESRPSANAVASESVDIELLRLASGASTTKTRRLEGKKETLLIASSSSGTSGEKNRKEGAAPSSSLNDTDLDALFASLPDATVPTQKPTMRVEDVFGDDLFDALPAPEPRENASRKDASVSGEDDSVSALVGQPSASTQEALLLSDFDAVKEDVWIQEAKRCVSVEAKRVFFSRKRSSCRRSCPVAGIRDDNEDETKNVVNEEEEGEEDKEIERLVQALVAQQLPDTARCLLNKKVPRIEPPTKKTRHNESDNDNKEKKEEQEGDDVDVSSKLAACVAAAQRENGDEYWRTVGATEAIMQLDELVRRQHEEVAAATLDEAADRERAERIVRICFAGRNPYVCGTDVMRRACAYWGAQLEDAQRKLAFYSSIRETEQKEIRQRLDDATRRLEDIEKQERLLQERYRLMRIG